MSETKHGQHWNNPETGQAECACCCGWALDYEALQKINATLLAALKAVVDFIPHGEWPENRCQVCGWTLARDMEKGCIPGNCSYRPDEPQAQSTIRKQRLWLTTKAAIAKAEPAPAPECATAETPEQAGEDGR
jgi:hypothetical protein